MTICRLRCFAALAVPLFLLAPTIAAAATAGGGTVAHQTRSVADFQAIAVSGPFHLIVRQAAAPSLQIEADENLLPQIETRVEDGRHGRTLRIAVKRGESIRPSRPIAVTVDVVKFERLESSGSGRVEVGTLSTPSLALRILGAGHARLHGLKAEALSVEIKGHGDVAAAGRVTRLSLSIAGSGEARLLDLSADEVSVGIAGSGDAEVTAHRTLAVKIAGSGDLVYAGNPSLSTSIAGSGRVGRR